MRPSLCVVIVLATCAAACAGRQPPPSTPAARPAGDVAVLSTAEGILMVSVPGGERTLHAASDVGWCVVDDRARVVWLTRGVEQRELAVLDLSAPREIVTVASPLPSVDEIIVDHGEAGRLGGGDPVSFRVALSIQVAESSIRAVVGCDGDGAVYCYDDAGALLPEYEAQRTAIDAVVVRDPALVASLAERSSGRALRSPEPASAELPRVTAVDEAACDEVPEDCGSARPLPGTPYWIVVTGNGRGDYFHQTEQIYDPSTHEFLDPRTGERAGAPLDSAGIEGLQVAPSTGALMIGGRVVTLDGAVVFEDEGAGPCGWVGGGWRVGGPRE